MKTVIWGVWAMALYALFAVLTWDAAATPNEETVTLNKKIVQTRECASVRFQQLRYKPGALHVTASCPGGGRVGYRITAAGTEMRGGVARGANKASCNVDLQQFTVFVKNAVDAGAEDPLARAAKDVTKVCLGGS